MTDAKKTNPIQVRLPEDLKTWLKHQAVDNRRSLNSELIHRLEQSRTAQLAGTQGLVTARV